MIGRAIERDRGGGFRLRLSAAERELLRDLPAELRSLLEAGSNDPSLRRLFPPAYEGDPDAETEYRELMHNELLGKHREALAVLEQTVDRDELREEEFHAWLAALNYLRLVLGTRLGITEELYEAEIDLEDPDSGGLGVYLYLTWLQEQFVEAAAGELPA